MTSLEQDAQMLLKKLRMEGYSDVANRHSYDEDDYQNVPSLSSKSQKRQKSYLNERENNEWRQQLIEEHKVI